MARLSSGTGAGFARAPGDRTDLESKELGTTEPELEIRLGRKSAEVTGALASFVRTIRSGDSRFDQYAAGKKNALNALEKTGLAVFRGKGNCGACHVGPNFTDERFHNTGVAWLDGRFADDGRFAISHNERERGAFKTPTLREIALTAPYMHDGSLATLDDVIGFTPGAAVSSQSGHRNTRGELYSRGEACTPGVSSVTNGKDPTRGWKN